jgi:magnesium transporter
MALRGLVWPTRDLVHSLERGEAKVLSRSTLLYLRDVYDHIVQIIDSVESLRDVVSGLVELYLSASSHRTNEVMKVLTIVATIFIPLTFVAGIYGMNFTHMPELAHRWAYPVVLGVMALIAGGMVIFFKRRKWM